MVKIFLNAGHCPDYDDDYGMKDAGAVNEEYGLTEAETVAKITKKVQHYLEFVGLDVKYLQSNNLRNGYDDDLSYPCIVAEANGWKADYAISIHLNAFNGVAKGTETWVHSRNSEGEALGRCIQNRIVGELGTIDRGIKYNEDKPTSEQLSFIKKTDMPAVLVECCFIDSEDVALLLTDDGLDKFARAIACGVTDYLGSE